MLVIEKDNNKFSFRASAIIFNKDKVLLHKRDGYKYWILPGGRVEMGECTKESIKRELKEELNITEDAYLNYIIESFKNIDNKNYHELNFCYYLEIDPKKYNLDKEVITGLDDKKDKFKWIKITELDNYNLKSNTIKNILKTHNNTKEVKHLIEKN